MANPCAAAINPTKQNVAGLLVPGTTVWLRTIVFFLLIALSFQLVDPGSVGCGRSSICV
jgi:hypothetical protein